MIKKLRHYNTPTLNREIGNYISGYTDGEGCFSVSFSKRPKLKMGWEVKPSFSVGQNYDRREVLDLMKEYFKCGFMRRDYSDKTLKYEIRSLEELLNNIVPHFQKFPLLSSKNKDFLLFAEICGQMRNFEHRNLRGIKKIINLAYKMNGSGKRKYSQKAILRSVQMKI